MYPTPYPLVVPGRVYPTWPMRMLTAPTMGLTERLMQYEAAAERLDKMLSLPFFEAPRPREIDTKTTWIERDHDIPATWRESADGKHAVLRVKGFRTMSPTASLEADGITLTITGEKKVKDKFKITKDMSVELPFPVDDPKVVRLSLGRHGLLTIKVPLEARAATPEATQLEVEVLAEDEPGELPEAGADKSPRAEPVKDEAETAAALEATLDEKFGFVMVEDEAAKQPSEQGERLNVEQEQEAPEPAAPPTDDEKDEV